MKDIRNIGLFAISALALASCQTLTKTATTADISVQTLSATVADLKVEDRISYTTTPSKAVQRGGMSNVKQAAESEALEAYAKSNAGKLPDLLVEPEYTIQKEKRLFGGSKVTSITVTGRPAYYVNFHSLHDSVWCNPTFRGLRTSPRYSSRKAAQGYYGYGIGGGSSSGKKDVRSGFGGMVNVRVGYSTVSADDFDCDNQNVYAGVSFGLGYNVNSNVYVGVGVGGTYVKDMTGLLIPIYAQGRYYFSNDANSPFFDMKIGKTVCSGHWKERYSTGVYFSPSIGYSFGSFEVSVEYFLTRISPSEDYYNDNWWLYDMSFDDISASKIHNIGINFGWKF